LDPNHKASQVEAKKLKEQLDAYIEDMNAQLAARPRWSKLPAENTAGADTQGVGAGAGAEKKAIIAIGVASTTRGMNLAHIPIVTVAQATAAASRVRCETDKLLAGGKVGTSSLQQRGFKCTFAEGGSSARGPLGGAPGGGGDASVPGGAIVRVLLKHSLLSLMLPSLVHTIAREPARGASGGIGDAFGFRLYLACDDNDQFLNREDVRAAVGMSQPWSYAAHRMLHTYGQQ
jgi:hypothetical protein